MRMIMLIEFPIEPFNTAIRNGSIGDKMHQILDATKPETAYFTERNGHRGGIFVVEVDSPTDVPRLAEPWFLTFNATKSNFAGACHDARRSGSREPGCAGKEMGLVAPSAAP